MRPEQRTEKKPRYIHPNYMPLPGLNPPRKFLISEVQARLVVGRI